MIRIITDSAADMAKEELEKYSITSIPLSVSFGEKNYLDGVDLDKEVKVDVPVEYVGVSRGVKLGGVMETYREVVRLSAKPMDMPAKITIDVTDMDINSSVTIETLPLPANVSAVFDQNYALVSIIDKSKVKGDAAEGEAE